MPANLVWRRKTLPNGLTVLLFPKPSANTAQFSVGVKYGSNQEPKKQAGVAHFLEHMLAGGSEERIKLSRKVEDHGGVLDFYTDREQVLGTMDVTAEKLPEAATILSELFFGEKFDNEKFETERKIILNELAEVADDPVVRVEELLLENLFLKHPIRCPVGGYPKTVKKLTLEQLTHEHSVNYVPHNMIVVLTGNVSEETLDETLDGFRDQKGAGAPQRPANPIEKAKPKPLIVEEKAGISQTYLSIGARTIQSNHPDTPALDLIGTLLGGGTSSRLFIELREKHAITYDVNSAHCKGTDFGYFGINLAVNNSKLDKAQSLILKELANLRTENVAPEELERAKQIMLGGVLRGMDSPHDCYEIITYMETQFGNEYGLKNYVERIRAVTCEDLRRVAGQFLAEDCLCTAILNPAGNAVKR
ncbi:MAG TPA: pitrilysin family protein [Candidatus Acidoferrales bacterium]|nr:pitrilysin family protein [Candidatus Acidoferrales bacterium]